MPVTTGTTSVYLSPTQAGGPDDLRSVVESELSTVSGITLATQQLSDPNIVAHLAARRRAGAPVSVLVEADYIRESRPVPPSQLWTPEAGSNATQRECLSALFRSAIDVRLDHMSALQHINLAILKRKSGPDRLLITSANLTPGNLDRHLNWGAVLADEAIAGAVRSVLAQAWAGDFRGLDYAVSLGGSSQIILSAVGSASQALTSLFATAGHRIDLAMFNITTSSQALPILRSAVGRGVHVRGVVDADQGGQRWDAVPALRNSGADIRYHPGSLTGGLGRMHLKLAVIDGHTVVLSTANLSMAARSSLEVCLILTDAQPVAAYINSQIDRLHDRSSPMPLPVRRP